MTTLAKTVFVIAGALAVVSCTVGEDKCGKGFKEKLGACAKVTATGGRTSVASTDADLDALGEENQPETVSGLHDSCQDQSDCANKGADYCAVDPTTGIGFCTIKDCTVNPDSCPGEYLCCKLPEMLKFPNMCLPPDTYENAKASLGFCAE
jgi:hypothetical protein